MDHLLSRVGPSKAPPSKYVSRNCKENHNGFPFNSLAAYHALNVASNAIYHHEAFQFLLQSLFCLFCKSRHSLYPPGSRGAIALSASRCPCGTFINFIKAVPTPDVHSGSDRHLSEALRERLEFNKVVLPGFGPGSQAPKARMIDRYTTGLWTADGRTSR